MSIEDTGYSNSGGSSSKKKNMKKKRQRQQCTYKVNPQNQKRVMGLALADKETIMLVARSGGLATHHLRGLVAIKDPEILKR